MFHSVAVTHRPFQSPTPSSWHSPSCPSKCCRTVSFQHAPDTIHHDRQLTRLNLQHNRPPWTTTWNSRVFFFSFLTVSNTFDQIQLLHGRRHGTGSNTSSSRLTQGWGGIVLFSHQHTTTSHPPPI